ncbi:hypothetical protein BJY52DRAFT_1227610 [Lactarius psammicola]|nr:hypothetical protein BJY52DRAFT_1227610 [Lactarius psammicola]
MSFHLATFIPYNMENGTTEVLSLVVTLSVVVRLLFEGGIEGGLRVHISLRRPGNPIFLSFYVHGTVSSHILITRNVVRFPTIYTTTSWWSTCTGNSAAFGSNALWIAHWATTIGTLPASWGSATFWQYADSGPFPGDQDRFIGDAAGLSSGGGRVLPGLLVSINRACVYYLHWPTKPCSSASRRTLSETPEHIGLRSTEVESRTCATGLQAQGRYLDGFTWDLLHRRTQANMTENPPGSIRLSSADRVPIGPLRCTTWWGW